MKWTDMARNTYMGFHTSWNRTTTGPLQKVGSQVMQSCFKFRMGVDTIQLDVVKSEPSGTWHYII